MRLKRLAQPGIGDDSLDAGGPRSLVLEGLHQQLGQVEHLDAVVAQNLGKAVVLVLRSADPRNPVEEQLVVIARGQPLQFRPGPVQQHRPQPAHFGVGAERARHAAEPKRFRCRKAARHGPNCVESRGDGLVTPTP